MTKRQTTIITIYAGNAYSAFRDNDLSQLKSKATKYLKKFSHELSPRHNGGYALMLMGKALSGDWNYDGKILDDTLVKAWLAIASGFELTCLSVRSTPKILLPLIRLFAAPSTRDNNFSEWVMKYQSELSSNISLIDGLDNLNDDCDIHKIIFNQ